jgi:hypothetical protein
LQGKESGDHQFYPRQEDGSYNKQGRSRYFCARVSGYVGQLIAKDETEEQRKRYREKP